MDMANEPIEEFSRERLMDDVRQYSCLYDRYCKDYQDKNVKKNAWIAVAAKYAISPEDAEKKYKTIRSSFTRFLKRKRNALPGSRNADGPTPIAFQNLDWLASHIDHKETSSLKWVTSGKSEGYLNEYSSLDEDDVYHGSYGEIVRNEEAPSNANGVIEVPTSSVGNGLVHESVSTERAPSQVVQSPGGPVIERAITMYYDKPNSLESANSDTVVNLKPVESFRAPFADVPTLKRKRIELHNGNDEDELFCLSLVANLKRLSPRRKAIAKMRFQQVLFDFEFPSSESDKA